MFKKMFSNEWFLIGLFALISYILVLAVEIQ